MRQFARGMGICGLLLVALVLAAPARAGEAGADAEALAKQKAAEAAKKRALERARAEELAKRKAAAAAAAAAEEAKDDQPRPKFREGEKIVEAVKGGKTVWTAQVGFPVGGVIPDPNFWIVFSKDETTIARLHAATGKMISRQTSRGTSVEKRKKQAAELVEKHLASLQSVESTPEVRARAAELIKSLGSADFQTREKASQELVKIGKPALEALEAARKSEDPEVVQRAEAAIGKIRGGETVMGLASLGWYAKVAVYKKSRAAGKEAEELSAKLAAAEKSGRTAEAAKVKAELAVAKKRRQDLDALMKQVGVQGAGNLPVGIPRGGVWFGK